MILSTAEIPNSYQNLTFSLNSEKMKSSPIQILPDELHIKILETGIQNSILTHKDLCSLSLSSNHFNKFSKEDTVWANLLTRDFPPFPPLIHHHHHLSSNKTLYRFKLERYIERKKGYDRRRVSKLELELEVLGRRVKRIKRELKWINVQMNENDGELLRMIKARYVVCHRKLAKITKKHTNIEKEVSSTAAKILNKDSYLPPFHDTSSRVFAEGTSNGEGNSKAESENSLSDISETEFDENSDFESELVGRVAMNASGQ